MHGLEAGGPQVDIWTAILIVAFCIFLSAFFLDLKQR